MATTKRAPKYRDLFARHLHRVVDGIVAAAQGEAEDIRAQLFGNFLAEYMFVCSACAGEFRAADMTEDDAVLCDECRR